MSIRVLLVSNKGKLTGLNNKEILLSYNTRNAEVEWLYSWLI